MTRPHSTHTYALLEVSPEAFEEVSHKLEAAGYDHAFHRGGVDGDLIDMHGIALSTRPRAGKLPETDAEAWQFIRDEIGFGITAVADEDGKLRDRCIDLLDQHAKDLAALREVLNEDLSGFLVGGDVPGWLSRLWSAACAVAGADTHS